jgi:LysR family transcriptional repressor of citA
VEIAWLRTFLVAAEEGNYHRAAERLHIAQPTVSLHIRKLEEAWGVKLFDRVGRHIELSKAGKRARQHAKRVYEAYVAGQEDLARWQQSYTETLTVAASPIVAMTYLARWMDIMQQAYPHLQIALLVADSAEVCSLVETGEADIGFSREEPISRRLRSEVLYEDPIRLVAPAGMFDHDGPAQHIDEVILRYPIITHNHPVFWDDFVVQLRMLYPTLRTMRVSRAHVSLHFVEQGLAASFLPASMIRQSLILGRIVEVDVPSLSLPVGHTYVVTRERQGTTATFLACVEQYMTGRR